MQRLLKGFPHAHWGLLPRLMTWPESKDIPAVDLAQDPKRTWLVISSPKTLIRRDATGMQRNLKQKTMAAIESLKCTSETRFDLIFLWFHPLHPFTSIYIQHRFWTVLYEYERVAGIQGTWSGAEADTSQSRKCFESGKNHTWNGPGKKAARC